MERVVNSPLITKTVISIKASVIHNGLVIINHTIVSKLVIL